MPHSLLEREKERSTCAVRPHSISPTNGRSFYAVVFGEIRFTNDEERDLQLANGTLQNGNLCRGITRRL